MVCHRLTASVCVALLASAAVGDGPAASDTDHDGIPDNVEETLLSTFSPVVYPGEAQSYSENDEDYAHPPLPVDWTIAHCYLIWYADDAHQQRIGDTGGAALTTDSVLMTVQDHKSSGKNYYYGIGYHDVGNRKGSRRDADRMSWSQALSQGRGIYGRVCPAPEGGSRYLVQYFMHFGWNETDTPPGCDLGNHEGDWICISLLVSAPDPSAPSLINAVFHNHGRQVFVESPQAMDFEDGHPVVYLERGTNEPWPYFGTGGMQPGKVPESVTTNSILTGDIFSIPCQLEWDADCNSGWTAVREHNSRRVRYRVDKVVNIGEKGAPYPGAEARFLAGYDGWWGAEWHGGCCWGYICAKVECPKAPMFQEKMWDDSYRVAECFVDFSYSGTWQTGEADKPAATLMGALMRTRPSGAQQSVIRIKAGRSNEKLTISLPVTIQAVGGPVTIGG